MFNEPGAPVPRAPHSSHTTHLACRASTVVVGRAFNLGVPNEFGQERIRTFGHHRIATPNEHA